MTRPLVASALLAGLLALSGCIHHVHEHGGRHEEWRGGPPPHAPAHGYRRHHGPVDLRYDASLSVYVVIGFPHHFFHDGHYFRRVADHWERCGNWEKGHWKPVEVALVPVPLAKHYKVKGPKHGKAKGHGHGPAKHDD